MIDLLSKRETLLGFGWTFAGRIVSFISQFILSILLARILDPSDYGVFAMIAVFLNLGLLLSDFGLGYAIIYYKKFPAGFPNSVFTLNLIFGVVITLTLFLSASYVSAFYGTPVLMPLLQVISITYLISSFGVVGLSLLKKELRFRKITLIENVSLFISFAAAILLLILAQEFGLSSLRLLLGCLLKQY